MVDGCHGEEATPTTHWRLEPVYNGGGDREGEGEGGESEVSSQYNECWQSSTTVETSGVTEGEGGREDGCRDGDRVDGATGQPTIAKLVSGAKYESVCTHTNLDMHAQRVCSMKAPHHSLAATAGVR